MEATRLYINKGDAPLFFQLDIAKGRAHDRIDAAQRDELLDFVGRAGSRVVPTGNRDGIAELVRLAEDEEQSFYRVLYVDDGSRVRACLGFGAVSGCDETYDCFGLVADGDDWAAAALDALVLWSNKAKARVLRFEIDDGNDSIAALALARGFVQEGRIPDFYRTGAGQYILIRRAPGFIDQK